MQFVIVTLMAATLAIVRPYEAQEEPAPVEPRMLVVASRVTFNIPMFGGVGNARCDSSGDLFFDVSTGVLDQGPFLRVSADGQRHKIYQLPSEAQKIGNIIWGVSPDGTLYVLHDDLTKHTLLRFSSDGSLAGNDVVEIPASVDAQHLAITDNGYAFLSGDFRSNEPLEKKRPGFAAILSPSGKIIRDLSPDAPSFDLIAAQKHPLDGDVVAGEDGRFYVLGGKDVRVLSQSGEVQNVFAYNKPIEDSYATRIDYSRGRISIIFHTLVTTSAKSAPTMVPRALVMNAQTGKIEGHYSFAASTTGSVVCYDSNEGYSLLAIEGQMAAKDVVPTR